MQSVESTPRTDDRGFSLIEMLIVIIVLGVLAAIVVFAVGSSRKDALAATCATHVRAIGESAEAVKVQTSSYPTGTVDATTAPNPLVEPATGALLGEWPASGEYVLRFQGTAGTSFVVNVFEADGTTAVPGCSGLS